MMHYLITKKPRFAQRSTPSKFYRFPDAKDGPGLLTNLAVVYAWSGELDNAFKTINLLTKMPNGISYGDLKLSVWWDPLRKDPRFGKLLTS